MFEDKVCVVVGGANGIGKKCVERFSKGGAVVAYMDIDKESGVRLKEKLNIEYGNKVFFFHGDAMSEEDADLFRNAIIGQFGRIDYFLNNVSSSTLNTFRSN